MVGGEGWGGGANNYGVVIYGDGDNIESNSLSPEQNDDYAPLIVTQTPDQPERGAEEPQSRRAGGTGRIGGGAGINIWRGWGNV